MSKSPVVKLFAVMTAAAFLPMLALSQAPGQSPSIESVPPGTTADSSLLGVTGPVEVAVRLSDAPLAIATGPNSRRLGSRLSGDAQRAYLGRLRLAQDTVLAQIAALGGQELGRVSNAYNAVMVSIDAEHIAAVRAIGGVVSVRRIPQYQLALSETVPYVGAAELHAGGTTGAGVKIAVIDSGIDYTHRNLGGPGTTAAYLAAYGADASASQNKTRDGLFPTAKVVEGFDFVGEVWPNGPRQPDPDPIDAEGHGTHVADIAAGKSVDGLHAGVAPDATLLAIKACSSVSTACSGIALLLALDFSLDPNGDGDITDAADVINLSLGTGYGQREDDLSQACTIAALFGVVVVASAGNDADRPYIASSPSIAPPVISVGQTAVPSAFGVPLVINAPPAIAGMYSNTALLSWAPVGAGFVNSPIVFVGRGCPADPGSGTPEDEYLANPAGKVALIDRGTCTVSLKVDRAANAGAIGVLIGLVAPGNATSFAYGGGTNFVPSLVITQSTSFAIKTQLTAGQVVLGTVTMSSAIPLTESMVASSSRGPTHSYNTIKPDIVAPGASVSAEVGTGNGETAFSGTSGAAPMVAGAAALLIDAYPLRTPYEVKALLVNSADNNVLNGPLLEPGVLAPVSRIGGGELRVNRAAALKTASWDAGDPASTSVAFYSPRLATNATYAKKIAVRNYLAYARTYSISPGFRYASDDASGAVALSAPPSVTVPANGTATFTLSMTVNAALLPVWSFNGGSRGGDGFRLQGHEFDGYVTISDSTDTLRLPWHILPHKAANISTSTSLNLGGTGAGVLPVSNSGAATSTGTVFSLTGTSPKLPASALPRPGDNFAVIDLRAAGVRFIPNALGLGADAIQFGVTTWGERSHPNYPAEFIVLVDTNLDGTDDFAVFTAENGGNFVSGQNVTSVVNLVTNVTTTNFFTDADLGSANSTLTVLSSTLSLARTTQFRFSALVGDNYYTGLITDAIGPMTYTLNTPRFTAAPDSFFVPPSGSIGLPVSFNAAGDAASPSQTGLLMLYRDALKGREAAAITITP
jgi:subtilisin family serine protease